MMRKKQDKTHKEKSQLKSMICLPLPSEVVNAADNGKKCENIGLWLDKFLPLNRQNWELTQDAKRRSGVFQIIRNNNQVQEIVNALKQRYEAILRWYEQQGFKIRQFEAKPAWRFVVGLGAAHVLETSITLHRIFGLPIIPSSGLKGAARAYAQLFEERDENDPDFVAIFGTTEQAGKIVFFDAIPLEVPKFELDIMNPHFPQYYDKRGGDKNPSPPADWDSPRPVFFLTVSEIPYCFAIAVRTKDAVSLLEIVEKWLKNALKELGIGAKTSADYGYWEL